ncbi:MAG: Methyltransferase type 11 [Candidatus Woesebacteria bacterium GW2011_GWA1_39_11b]|nr:MAG: Methyltransferase type 11 [Candidatus Woesebacteria bacterium GW2011_GWA1_39_11b]
MSDMSKQKRLQKKFADNVFKSYFLKGKKEGPYVDSLIGNFIENYTLDKVTRLLPFSIKDLKILSMCGGDGFEGEYLYKLGAEVTVSDISPEAVKAIKRGRPFLKGVVADSENLPFKNGSFDLVLVRHGLHHLEHPYKGIYEMNRIGKKGFVFIEAQRNFITKILIKLKIALEYEAPGNYVYRFTRGEIKKLMKRLKIKNYKVTSSWNYHIDFLTEHVYPRLNNNFFFSIFLLLFYFFNFLFGYFGNSIVVVALKD